MAKKELQAVMKKVKDLELAQSLSRPDDIMFKMVVSAQIKKSGFTKVGPLITDGFGMNKIPETAHTW